MRTFAAYLRHYYKSIHVRLVAIERIQRVRRSPRLPPKMPGRALIFEFRRAWLRNSVPSPSAAALSCAFVRSFACAAGMARVLVAVGGSASAAHGARGRARLRYRLRSH